MTYTRQYLDYHPVLRVFYWFLDEGLVKLGLTNVLHEMGPWRQERVSWYRLYQLAVAHRNIGKTK